MQNHCDHFAMPDSFLPDRWLKNSQPYSPCNKAAFTAFSAGDRQCLGKKFIPLFGNWLSLAWMELRLVLSHFAFLFDAEILPSSDPGYRYTVVVHPDPLCVHLTPASATPVSDWTTATIWIAYHIIWSGPFAMHVSITRLHEERRRKSFVKIDPEPLWMHKGSE